MTDAEAAYWAAEITNEELDALADQGLSLLSVSSEH
jgi:hypothetical protein